MPAKTKRTRITSSPTGITLSAEEARLALIGLADFEGQWDVLEAAAGLTVDGDTKAVLIRDRLLPIADQLPAFFADGFDAFRLWTARHWFANQFCKRDA